MNRIILNSHKLNNFIHTLVILATMTGMICLLGWILAGSTGVLYALFLAGIVAAFSPQLPTGLILKASKARPLSAHHYPELYKVVMLLARRASLDSPPPLYSVPSREMNAFVVGSEDNAAICLTEGILQHLHLRELTGILGHEIAHIKNNDLQVMRLAEIVGKITHSLSAIGHILLLLSLPAFLAGALHYSSVLLLILILAPILSLLLQLALSRIREFAADLGSAQLTGDAYGLISALRKIDGYHRGFWRSILLPTWNHQPSLLRTHPPTHERIERLIALGSKAKQPYTLPIGQGVCRQPIVLREIVQRPSTNIWI